MASRSGSASVYIAGSSAAVPRPGRANSGYLVRSHGNAIALDFGSGVFARVRQEMEPAALDAIVISHMHADHFFDLVPLRYAIRYETKRAHPLPIYLPPGGIGVAKTIGSPLKETADFYDGVLDLREYSPGEPLEIGACTIRFAATVHYVPAYAMRVETRGGVLGYSADTAPCERVERLVSGADVFLSEAALGPNGAENGSRRGHLNAREAGELAARAAVKHLVLTHYDSQANPAELRAEAARAFHGKITVADDGMSVGF